MTESQIKTKFTEQINIKKAIALQQLSNAEMKSLFWDKEEVNKMSGENWNYAKYFLNIKKYLKEAISKNGKINKNYKFGKLEGCGRLYVDGGVGIQSLQNKIKNYLCGEYYYDFDIKNAHPSILLHICNKFEINAPNLKEYIVNRQTVLSENDLSKKDILIAINKDKNKNKRDNTFYNSFIKELEKIKPLIKDKINNLDIKTNNEDNPLSSIINKYMLRFEGDIIQKAIKFFGKNADVPMFDGIMINKKFSKEVALDFHLESLNDLFKDEFNGLIKFSIKSTDSDIELNLDNDFRVLDYSEVKPKFEKNHFLTIKPFAYWKQNKRADGSFTYNQIKESDFKNACEEYKIIDYNAKGELITPSIFKKWIGDPKKRKYECIDFIPFGKEDTCPSHCFNTFEGFEVNKTSNYEETNTDNFDELIKNLCNNDEEMNEYLMKYVAHMVQFPNKRTEKIIVLKGWTGTGKDTLFRTLRRMMGTKYVDITESPESLFGNFNDIMDSKLCLFMNELEGVDGIKYQEKLKAVASNIKNKVNGKFEKVVEQNNYCRIFVNSNNDGCVNIQVSDRRYVIIKTGFGLVQNVKEDEQRKKVETFWTSYYNNLNDINWLKSLYNKLMNINLSDFNVKKSPVGEEKKIMREKNISPIYKYVKDIIDNENYEGFLIKTIKKEKLHFIKFKEFTANFREWLEYKNYKSDFKIKDTSIKQKLVNCDNSFLDSKQIIHEVEGEKKKEKFAVFKMDDMKKFLNNFIFTESEEQPTDFGELELGENKNEMIMTNDLDDNISYSNF
tara:strand:+ start:89 stop:2440 length:2352 start_codon:yes stop_codon:yes gene_type:complete